MIEENRASAADIDLSHEQSFALGELRVNPSTREVRRNGSLEVLEPRVMQVLVALAKADGAVVSREDLYDACWGGRIVGDDALQRCIARLRKFANYNGTPSFVIETIPRVGYRLVPLGGAVEEQVLPEVGPAPTPPPPASGRRLLFIYGPWAAAGLAVAAVAAYFIFDTAEPRWRVDDVRIAVSDPGSQLWPALSPDGSAIAYAQWTRMPSYRDIYVRAVGGLQSRRLTTGLGEKYAPQWSPDGRRIGYVVTTPGQPCTIMAIPVAGGTPQQLARCMSTERTSFAWTRDRLFFADAPSAGAAPRIVAVDLSTGKRTGVTHTPSDETSETEPAVSPDGLHIAFRREVEAASETQVIIADTDGRHERTLIASDMARIGFAWTEDSKAIVYAMSSNHHSNIWVQPLEGERYPVQRGAVEFERLSEIRGGRIAAEGMTWDINLTTPRSESGAAPDVIDRAPGQTLRPSFRADGTAAFVSDRSGELALWIKRPGLAAAKLATGRGTPFGQPIWSPDGSRIAVPVRDGRAARVAITTEAGGAVTTIAPPDAREINRPAWTGDGLTLIVPAFDDRGGWRLWRAGIASGAVVPFSSYGWRAISIRGDVILQIQSGVAGIWRMDGGMRRLAPYPLPQELPSMEIEGDRVLYADSTVNRAIPRVFSQPLAGGAPTIVAELEGGEDQGFTFDPRTRKVVYPSFCGSDENIALITLSRD